MKLGFGSFDIVSWNVIEVELGFAPTGLAPSLTLPRGEGTDSLDSSIENAKSVLVDNSEVSA